MLQINGKTFMNLQEAVQWLLDNNALPFQSSANYVANTEIGMGTIVNPSPAKVRIGSLIFFADSKVSTVIGLTENGFIVSDQYNNLVDDIAYVTGVSINASGHLITTLSDGQTIDAGQIKQVSSFSIDGSQHLVVSYNDGSTTDLGAIFQGNVNISGTLNVSGAISGAPIVETMTGYTFTKRTEDLTWTAIYASAVKNGNKITFVIFGKLIKETGVTWGRLAYFKIPSEVGAKLYPYTVGGIDVLDNRKLTFTLSSNRNTTVECSFITEKASSTTVAYQLENLGGLTDEAEYYFRIEQTFLLAENLAS